MIIKLRNSCWTKVIAVFMAVQILVPLFLPTQMMAITGGPSQPENTSFTAVGVSDMVDIFSGDFQYNIPLMDVGGYPINISYSGNISMEQQATDVGLGWSLNAGGVINRSMRGVPDDFDGTDKIINTTNLKPNTTVGANVTFGDIEIIGKNLPLKADVGFGLFVNNYTGLGFEFSADASLAIGDKNKPGLNLGLGLTANSDQGIGIRPKVGLSYTSQKNSVSETRGFEGSLGFGATYNSRAGLRSIGIEAGFKATGENFKKNDDGTRGESIRSGKASANGNASIPIGRNSYIPQIGQSMLSTSVSVDIGTGLEGFWINGKLKLGGYFNDQRVIHPRQEKSAYGYMYADLGAGNDNAMHDFNREKDAAFSDNTPALPMTQMTYDIFTASGQGVSGMYHPYRDFGSVYDPSVSSYSTGVSLGADLGATQLFKAGVNVSANFNYSRTGRWTGGSNPNSATVKFNGKSGPTYEPVYFKSAGEFSSIDEDYFNKIQGVDPVRIDVTEAGDALQTYKRRKAGVSGGETNSSVVDNHRTKRDRKNGPFTILTADEASSVGLDKSVKFYNPTLPYGASPAAMVARTDDGRKGHHISEITVSKNDGTRYIYGTQAYNYKQKEVSFNTKGRAIDFLNGLVTYNPGDNSVDNNLGIDHYYSCTEMPAYATAFDLTAVLSPDYSDSDGQEGPSPGDLGNYTKFNYARIYDKSNPYRWRNPYGTNQANYSEGYKSKQADNKGNYIYGEKEIQVLHTIETKNYVAEFYYSDRKDAYDVIDENGGQGANTLPKLDRIELYTRCDREKNGVNAIALKKVHFVYDYSLCAGIPSNKAGTLTGNEIANQGGKLTLKKIYFTYQDSKKGELSPYIFHYADPDHDLVENHANNPDYNFRGNDRWGNYKPNNTTLPNAEDPYVEQNKVIADQRASAWCINTIQLPSGGIIKIDLESDDYAYVQNKRATRMFKLLGFGPTSTTASGKNDLYKKEFLGSADDNLYMFIDAPDVSSDVEFRKHYLGEGNDQITQLFFKFLIDLTGKSEKEYVSGYADVDVAASGWSGGRGWIKIKSTSLGDKDFAKINPIAKTAMQFVRLNLPEYLFGDNPEDMPPASLGVINKLAGLIKDVQKMVEGTNRVMRNDGFGRFVDLDKSFVRLQTPNYKKLGGGARVTRIAVNDRWSTMKGDPSSGDFEYGQTYDYSKIADDPKSSISVGSTISSGVAEYEPFVGNEENPLRNPVAYSEERKMAPDNDFYQETPYGEMFYPSAAVGYSSVKVTNLSHSGVARTATGYVVHEFYTAKDFPVKVRNPILERKPKKPSWLRSLFKINIKDYMTTSQSYAIELNNMHGKPKAQYVYAEGQKEAISSKEYFYKTQTSDQLSNSVTVIGKDGKIRTAQAGIEVDMVSDERESESSTYSAYIPGNLDISAIPPPFPIPVPLPSVWPKVSSEETRFRSIANTKVITRYAILEKTLATDLGSRVSTDNLAWDQETGEVLLTRTQNDFEDPIYSFTYPAHWGYNGMGQAYQNLGDEFIAPINGNGLAVIPNASSYFVPGDEVYTADLAIKKHWVTAVNANAITLTDAAGLPATAIGSTTVKIVRSGRRNQQSMSVGSVKTLTNPIQGVDLVFKDVLNAGAVEFENEWPGYCECVSILPSTNPFVNGEKGNYRVKRSHLFLTGRGQSSENRNTNIRKDGTFANFDPFWNPYFGKDWKINNGRWTFASEVTLYSPVGFELENRDALDRYSSADYKYNNTLPAAVASNARYKEIGFDNFEDYTCEQCKDDHFSFKQYDMSITETQAHSGRRSIKVSAGETIQIEKIIVPCQEIVTVPN